MGEVRLGAGRRVAVRIRNLGPLGALVQASDLEEAVLEGERALLVHPDEDGSERTCRTPCAVVRVELEFEEAGVRRELALYFDGGPPPEGEADGAGP